MTIAFFLRFIPKQLRACERNSVMQRGNTAQNEQNTNHFLLYLQFI